MKILVLGAGALGGYFGARLIEAGEDITFLVREGRRKQLESAGLRVKSPYGDFSAPVQTVSQETLRPDYDLVLLSCKAYDLDAAMDAIAPAIGPRASILPVLNGLSHMDQLNARFGQERVLGGVARIAATLTPEGVIEHLNDWCFIDFGEQDGTISARATAIQAAFGKSTIKTTLEANILQNMWNKLVFLATLAGVTCLMRANVGEIARTPDGSEIVRRFLETNAAIAAKAGYAQSESSMENYRRLLADKTSTITASMLRDIEGGGRIEGDHIIGFLLEKARDFGLDATLHEVVSTHLKAYEQRREAGRLKA